MIHELKVWIDPTAEKPITLHFSKLGEAVYEKTIYRRPLSYADEIAKIIRQLRLRGWRVRTFGAGFGFVVMKAIGEERLEEISSSKKLSVLENGILLRIYHKDGKVEQSLISKEAIYLVKEAGKEVFVPIINLADNYKAIELHQGGPGETIEDL